MSNSEGTVIEKINSKLIIHDNKLPLDFDINDGLQIKASHI